MTAIDYIRRNWLNENYSPDYTEYYCIVIPHLFLEELKYIVFKCLQDTSLNFEQEARSMLSLYHFTDEINNGIAEYKERFLQYSLSNYRNHVIRTPNKCWGYLFDEYYDGTNVLEVWSKISKTGGNGIRRF